MGLWLWEQDRLECHVRRIRGSWACHVYLVERGNRSGNQDCDRGGCHVRRIHASWAGHVYLVERGNRAGSQALGEIVNV